MTDAFSREPARIRRAPDAGRAHEVFAADADGDGDTDLLSASQNDDEIAGYENTNGLGSFRAQQLISTATSPARSVLAADVDRAPDPR